MRKIVLLLAFLAVCIPVKAQTPVALSPVAKQQFFDNSGAPLAGGCVFTYITGTSTPLATYTDGTGTAVNTNPVILDSAGRASIWLSNASYRFSVFSSGGTNCATGNLQYTMDQVSAYTIINQAQNLFLFGAASDPAGTAGELGYRTDIPCFRGFTTFWDCFVRLTDPQTLTNKTFSASDNTLLNGTNTDGHYLRNNGTQYVDSTLGLSDLQQSYTNSSSIAPIQYRLVTLSGAPSVITLAPSSATGGIVGICVSSNCNTLGATSQVQSTGVASCVFDGATTAGDYVQASGSVGGECHDEGGTYPTTGQVLGRVLSTNGAGGTYGVLLFSTETAPRTGIIVSADSGQQTANISSSALYLTPGTCGVGCSYQVQCYVSLTQAATSSSTMPSCVVGWTDADTSVVESLTLSSTSSANTLGTVQQGGAFLNVKATSVIHYSTTGYVSSGATPMGFTLHIRLLAVGPNI